MTEKGMLISDKTNMKHIYSPAIEEKKTKGFLLEKFVDTMYNGSSSSLMMQLLGNKKTSQEEIDEIRTLLDKLENK
ncbi:Penicillinase repressor [compost metagenome]